MIFYNLLVVLNQIPKTIKFPFVQNYYWKFFFIINILNYVI